MYVFSYVKAPELLPFYTTPRVNRVRSDSLPTFKDMTYCQECKFHNHFFDL